jgi:hypothetical protein
MKIKIKYNIWNKTDKEKNRFIVKLKEIFFFFSIFNIGLFFLEWNIIFYIIQAIAIMFTFIVDNSYKKYLKENE